MFIVLHCSYILSVESLQSLKLQRHAHSRLSAKACSFETICKIALKIAHCWQWNQPTAIQLIEDLRLYNQCKAPFVGGDVNGKEWWETLPISAEQHPIKVLVITLFSIIPHATEVERLFLDLRGIQGVRQCNLSVRTFEILGKLHASYTCHIHDHTKTLGKPTRRQHAHMHTHETTGIDINLTNDLEESFVWRPPLAVHEEPDVLKGPEGVSMEDIDAAFDKLAQRTIDQNVLPIDPQLEGENIAAGHIYSFDELEKIDAGVAPTSFNNEIQLRVGQSANVVWDVASVLVSKGISS
ncbi:hypothetical protein AcV7_007222 [Taiwanofungus camphoratus]|nr:hypothetical protein AcV7_007222 [Antrodia cinnamomea]